VTIDTEFADPGTMKKLDIPTMKHKYNQLLARFEDHLQGGKFAQGDMKSAMGMLQLCPSDVFLVICVESETQEISSPSSNIIVVDRQQLEALYGPSLSIQLQFFWQERQIQLVEEYVLYRPEELSMINTSWLQGYCDCFGIKVKENVERTDYLAAIGEHLESVPSQGRSREAKECKNEKRKREKGEKEEQEEEKAREKQNSTESRPEKEQTTRKEVEKRGGDKKRKKRDTESSPEKAKKARVEREKEIPLPAKLLHSPVNNHFVYTSTFVSKKNNYVESK